MRTKAFIAGIVLVVAAYGQDAPLDPQKAFQVALPPGGPLALQAADWGASKATARGGAVLVDLRSTLQLKNTGTRRIRAVSLLVLAQEATPGGKASVTVPSLDIAPGESFPVRIDLRLMRPLAQAGGALVEVGLDGVLFEDLTFYGPNRLNSRRAMLAWELEARRERKALLAALQAGGADRVREEMLATLGRQAEQGQLTVARAGRSTNAAPARSLPVAFLALPDAPVELLSGWMDLAGSELRGPRVELRNASRKAVRFVEISWLVEDLQGRRYAAGSLPAELSLAPGARTQVARDAAMRLTRAGGAAAEVGALAGYLQSVEFEDGEMWVPTTALEEARRKGLAPAGGELQRLAELYRRKGLDSVLAELRRFR
jgi:hypothetical protein